MADLTRMGAGAQRLAEAVVRGTGGRSVLLRRVVPDESGGMGQQLGLGTPAFSDAELAPVVLRAASGGGAGVFELLLPASAAAMVAGSASVAVVLAMFADAVGVVVDGAVMRVVSVGYEQVEEAPVLYRLRLQAPASAVL